MIFRLSQKVNSKIKAGGLGDLPLDDNPFADWSVHLFVAHRTQYIMLSNTKSLYSTVMIGKGIVNKTRFTESALNSIRESMENDRLEFVYQQLVVPFSGVVRFAKPLSRAVSGSMNDLINHAKLWLTDGELSPYEGWIQFEWRVFIGDCTKPLGEVRQAERCIQSHDRCGRGVTELAELCRRKSSQNRFTMAGTYCWKYVNIVKCLHISDNSGLK